MKLLPVLVLLLGAAACSARGASPAPEGSAGAREGSLEGADGVRLFYRAVGDGPDTVVFVHGGPGLHSAHLERDLAPLSEGRTVLYYDQRGGGRSELPADTAALTLANHVRDLEALRAHFGLRRMSLVAHSFGPAVAVGYALLHPERVERMVLVGPIPPRRGDFYRVYGANLAARLTPEERDTLSRLGARMSAGPDAAGACRSYWRLAMPPRLADPARAAELREDYCDAPEEALRYGARFTGPLTSRSMGDWDWRAELAGLRVPTLVVHGERDPIPMDRVEEWVIALPDARLLRVPGAGHFPFVERPDVFYPAVGAFLDGGWPAGATADLSRGAEADSGTIVLYHLQRRFGAESYRLAPSAEGADLEARFAYVDRGTLISLDASLRIAPDLTPRAFTAKGKTYRFVNVDAAVEVDGGVARTRLLGDSATVELPDRFFTLLGYAPLSAQALLVRYWERHGRPETLATLPAGAAGDVRVGLRGVDTVRAGGREVALRRYSVDGVTWGREALWLDADDRFAALTTRVHLLPLEGVRADLEEALPALREAVIRDRMADLEGMRGEVAPLAEGTFALRGVRLIDGTGRAPVDDATVVVRDGRLAAVGPSADVPVPAGVQVLEGRGRTVVPGLWDMHGHVSQIEWGPAYLAAGVTTVRDVGGENAFLVAMRRTLDSGRGLGPRMLLAGLVDGGGEDGFGPVVATTPAEGRAVVERYHADGFEQMKLYTLLRPDVVRAVTGRAHELGMTVTGHVPRALSLAEAGEAGMDGIEHLPVRGDPAAPEVRGQIETLARQGMVITPTLSWSELLSRAPETPISSFEPGIETAPPFLAYSYRSVQNDTDPAAVAGRLRQQLSVVGALHAAGVPLVAGTDAAVPGHSLLREVELLHRAGLSPMEAIRAATAVPARVMGMEDDAGTIEVGKRADLLVLDADPLADISNLRRARWVIADGRAYDPALLWRIAGFRPPLPDGPVGAAPRKDAPPAPDPLR